MDPASFRRQGHDLVDWIAEYLEHSETYPVLSGFHADGAGSFQRRLFSMDTCRRAAVSEEALDAANERLINLVNQTGDVFLSHTRLRGRIVLRIAIGHLETTDRHVRRAWDLLVEHAAALAPHV
jgi:glutamate/tyrosine decarboxylase-like PLP-dependent enzyme